MTDPPPPAAAVVDDPRRRAADAAAAPQAGGVGFFDNPIVRSLAQAYMIYVVFNYALRFLPGTAQHTAANGLEQVVRPSASSTTGGGGGGGGIGSKVAPGQTRTVKVVQESLIDVWEDGSLLNVQARLSTSEDPSSSITAAAVLPEVKWEGIPYKAGWETRVFETEFEVPESVKHNESLWLDVSVKRAESTVEHEVLHVRKLLTRYMPQRKIRIAKKLIGGSKLNTAQELELEAAEIERERVEVQPIISYWHPNVTLEIVANPGVITYSALPDPLKVHVRKANEGEMNEQGQGYMYPIVWVNNFWQMTEHYYPINETTRRLPIRIELKPTSHFKWQILASLEDSMTKSSEASSTPGAADAMDAVKRIFVEGNPYMLIATIVCSVLHMVFEFLAFTSDVKHWRSKKDLVGASVNTIITNCVVQLIVLLYLMDNNEDTSKVILFTQGMGLMVEAWKITKAVDIAVVPTTSGIMPYKLRITDKHVLSEDEKRTQEFDRLAFKYVAWVMTPCLGGYTIYSLLNNEHRGWYSFVVTTLVSFVYAFGFVQLVPQLIINYKLKSVAHIPMKAMAYKFFSTIVDDAAAFVVKQPFFYRLSVFRDDVVFVVLLWQMYIYRVDPTRANEYGQKLTEEEAKKLLEAKEDKSVVTEEKKMQ